MTQNSIASGLLLLHTRIKSSQYAELYFNHLKELMNDVPIDISDYFGYEYQLNSYDNPDLLVCIHKLESLTKLIEIQTSQQSNNQKSIESSANLLELSKMWNDKFKNHIKNIWLEFDSKNLFEKDVKFSFFYAPSLTANILELALVNQKIYKVIMGEELKKEISRNLVLCYKSLPHGACISQIGMMKARSIEGLRLFIQNVKSIPEYLESLSYPHYNNKSLIKLLELGQKFCSKIELDIDIKDTIQEKIGLEYYFTNSESAIDFIHECISLSYCNKEIIERFLPENFSSMNDPTYFHKVWFSHYKINFQVDQTPFVKAYIGLKKLQTK